MCSSSHSHRDGSSRRRSSGIPPELLRQSPGVTVTDEPSAIKKWIRKVRRQRFNRNSRRRRVSVVGLAMGKEVNNEAVSTLHICVERACLIIQLLNRRRRVLDDLSRLFSNNRITFADILNAGDAINLETLGIEVAYLVDVKDFLGFDGNQNPSYKQVVEAAKIGDSYSRFDLNPAVTNSNWSKPELDEEQISQAAADAFLRYKIGMKHVRY